MNSAYEETVFHHLTPKDLDRSAFIKRGSCSPAPSYESGQSGSTQHSQRLSWPTTAQHSQYGDEYTAVQSLPSPINTSCIPMTHHACAVVDPPTPTSSSKRSKSSAKSSAAIQECEHCQRVAEARKRNQCERRKEQNRTAQRKFREVKEARYNWATKRASELEQQLTMLVRRSSDLEEQSSRLQSELDGYRSAQMDSWNVTDLLQPELHDSPVGGYFPEAFDDALS